MVSTTLFFHPASLKDDQGLFSALPVILAKKESLNLTLVADLRGISTDKGIVPQEAELFMLAASGLIHKLDGICLSKRLEPTPENPRPVPLQINTFAPSSRDAKYGILSGIQSIYQKKNALFYGDLQEPFENILDRYGRAGDFPNIKILQPGELILNLMQSHFPAAPHAHAGGGFER